MGALVVFNGHVMVRRGDATVTSVCLRVNPHPGDRRGAMQWNKTLSPGCTHSRVPLLTHTKKRVNMSLPEPYEALLNPQLGWGAMHKKPVSQKEYRLIFISYSWLLCDHVFRLACVRMTTPPRYLPPKEIQYLLPGHTTRQRVQSDGQSVAP